MPVHLLEFCFNLQKANMKKYHGFVRLVLTSLLFKAPEPPPSSSDPGAMGTLTVTGGGRAALPAVLAFPFFSFLLSAFPLPARAKGGNPGWMSVQPTTLNSRASPSARANHLPWETKMPCPEGVLLSRGGTIFPLSLARKGLPNKRRAGPVDHFLSHLGRRQ